MRKGRLLLLSWAIVVCGVAAAACGQSTTLTSDVVTPAATVCPPHVAQIMVGDGFLIGACGCTGLSETKGKTYSGGTPLACHLPSSVTSVYFYYLGSKLPHQIISVGANTFPSSALSDPSDELPNRILVHVVQFAPSQAGMTFNFQDAFGGSSGQLFVP